MTSDLAVAVAVLAAGRRARSRPGKPPTSSTGRFDRPRSIRMVPVDDDEELVARLTLEHQDLARLVALLAGEDCDGLDAPLVEVGEQRDPRSTAACRSRR